MVQSNTANEKTMSGQSGVCLSEKLRGAADTDKSGEERLSFDLLNGCVTSSSEMR